MTNANIVNKPVLCRTCSERSESIIFSSCLIVRLGLTGLTRSDMQDLKYKGIYQVNSLRIKNWDYSSDGFYFITICTKGKQNYFGKLNKNAVALNRMGKIAEEYWMNLPALTHGVSP